MSRGPVLHLSSEFSDSLLDKIHMIHPRQILLLSATGFLLVALVLAFGMGVHPITISPRLAAAPSGSAFGNVSTTTLRGNKALLDSGVTPLFPSRRSQGIPHFESSASVARHGASSGDPLIASFKELRTMTFQTVDPELPGHSLAAFGRRAAVAETGKAPGSNGVILSLEMEPDIPAIPGENPPLVESVVATATTAWSGFSYEQELFRTKWGWQAFDQVQRLLREQSSP
jgi:hypothetical protein